MVRWLASLPPSEDVRPVCFVIIVGLSVGSERMQGTVKSRNSNQQKTGSQMTTLSLRCDRKNTQCQKEDNNTRIQRLSMII